MYRWQREQTSTERQAGYLNWMLTDSSHAKEIRLFDLGSSVHAPVSRCPPETPQGKTGHHAQAFPR
jgi:hypothetical protein